MILAGTTQKAKINTHLKTCQRRKINFYACNWPRIAKISTSQMWGLQNGQILYLFKIVFGIIQYNKVHKMY